LVKKEHQYQRALSPPPSGEIKILYFPKYVEDEKPPEEEESRRPVVRRKRSKSRIDPLPDESEHTPAVTEEDNEEDEGAGSELPFDDAEEGPEEGEEKEVDPYAHLDKWTQQQCEDEVDRIYRHTDQESILPYEKLEGQSPRDKLKRVLHVRDSDGASRLARQGVHMLAAYGESFATTKGYDMKGFTDDLMQDKWVMESLQDVVTERRETLQKASTPTNRFMLAAGAIVLKWYQRAAAALAAAKAVPDPAAGVGPS